MLALAATSFAIAVLIVLAFNLWLPAEVKFGKPFWILTLVIVAIPLIFWFIYLATPADPYGYRPIILFPAVFVFGPAAVGWLLGIIIVTSIRMTRTRNNKRMKS